MIVGSSRGPRGEESASLGRRLLAVVPVAIGGILLLYLAYKLFQFLLNHLVGVSIVVAVAIIIATMTALYFLISRSGSSS
jgi:hypothetical protein